LHGCRFASQEGLGAVEDIGVRAKDEDVVQIRDDQVVRNNLKAEIVEQRSDANGEEEWAEWVSLPDALG